MIILCMWALITQLFNMSFDGRADRGPYYTHASPSSFVETDWYFLTWLNFSILTLPQENWGQPITFSSMCQKQDSAREMIAPKL